MSQKESAKWTVKREVSLGLILQLLMITVLVLGSWFNLQSQLDLLHRDVQTLIESNRRFQMRLQQLNDKSIAFEYRLKAVESQQHKTN